MAPGLGPLPPARGPEGNEAAAGSARPVDVVPKLNRHLGTLPPKTVRRMRLGLRIFDLMSFPWRFSRASLPARQDFLAKMEAAGGLRAELLLALKLLVGIGYCNERRVRDALGYEMTCRVEGEAPRIVSSESPLGDLTVPSPAEDCDVAIVGSGAGGAVAATLLAEAGLDVAVLEAGPYMDARTYPEEPLAALEALYRDGGLTIAEGRPAIPVPVGRAVGGTTVINSGTCFRAPETVLDRWQADHGIPWASELTPDYVQGEEMLDVAPVDPSTMGRNGQLMMEGAEALGVSHAPLARNAGRCVQCSSCPGGCKLDQKQAMHVSYLPRAVAAGARIRSGVEVKRIVFEGARAVGLDGLAATPQGDGETAAPARPYSLHARKAVVLAGGAFGTPELLMRSGFASPSGELGRNLRIHPACWVGARFAEEVRGWDGIMQSYAVNEWEDRGVLLEATFTPLAFGAQWLPGTGLQHQEKVLNYDRIASTGVHLSDRSSGRVGLAGDGSLRLTYKLTDDDARRLSFGIARAAELLYAAGAEEVYPQIAGIPTIARERIPELDASSPKPSRLRLEAFHPMGTARMDADPKRGVVGSDGAVHGAEDLYVADGALLPSSIGVNPMMTIIAMASRVARQVADRLS